MKDKLGAAHIIINTLILLTMVTGILTLTGLVFSYLALTDFYHNTKSDIDKGWNIVRI